MNALEHLTTLNTRLQDQQTVLIKDARSLIDNYWEFLHAENKRISALHSTGQTGATPDLNVNSVAPVIEFRGNQGYSLKKPYLVWKRHSPKFRKNLKTTKETNGKPSLPLHNYSAINVLNMLTRECTWNAPKAIELEEKLIQFRVSINTLHELIKKTSATIRSLEKTNAKKETINE